MPEANAPGAEPDDPITPDKLLGCFTVAYILDAVGLLDAEQKQKLDSLRYPNCPSWDAAVESSYGINRTFVRSVYAHCTEIQSPPMAIGFILRGLGCPEYEAHLQVFGF